VNEYIARLRHSKPGVTLISPPPHHDIYSIEDLSQLIHDLRCINPNARIAVKLAAQSGIGTVAAGVAKAGADCIIVSSGDGGTGAAPLSSLDYAGSYWEAALPEVRQVLAMNSLDINTVIQVDGRLRTARDVVIAAILGAREFAFGTAALIAMGCIACGKCNLGKCPVGIATQEPEFRAKFKGRPEHLSALFKFLAEDVRTILASLGAKTIDEVLGKYELLDFQLELPPHEKKHSISTPSEKRSKSHGALLLLKIKTFLATRRLQFRFPKLVCAISVRKNASTSQSRTQRASSSKNPLDCSKQKTYRATSNALCLSETPTAP